MDISFDPEKNARNIAERGLSFAMVAEFEWQSAFVLEGTRMDYGERRFQALGYIAARLHVLVFTPRGDKVHVISLRKANSREIRRYETQTQS